MPAAATRKAIAKRPTATKKAAAAVPVVTKQVAQAGKVPSAKRVAAKPSAKVGTKANAKAGAKKPAAPVKLKKVKLVRDSFSMPENEYAVLGAVKKASLKAGIEVKKSELLRIGVALIRKIDLAALKRELAALPPLKVGRPTKEK
jgi:hypothetical protein